MSYIHNLFIERGGVKNFALVCLSLMLFAGACRGGAGLAASDVAGAPPWQTKESLSYVMKNRAGQTAGQGTLGVAVQGSETILSERIKTVTDTDDSWVVVDSLTLKPVASTRQFRTVQHTGQKPPEDIEVSYSGATASIKQGEKETVLNIPPHSYDNYSSLFHWRTLPFHEGYESRYVNIVTNSGQLQTVTLRVGRLETVSVMAGEFQAWRLDMSQGSTKQVAWFADTAARPLVKYDNGHGYTFELEKLP